MSAGRSEPVVSIPSGRVLLEGILELPKQASGVVAFSHDSGSGRHSPRNRYVAQRGAQVRLRDGGRPCPGG